MGMGGMKFFEHSFVKYTSIVLLFLSPIILLILPADFFDSGNTICLSVFFFDVEYYGCGMTRELMHFIHFEFNKAMEFNKLVILVFPFLFLLCLKMISFCFGKDILKWF